MTVTFANSDFLLNFLPTFINYNYALRKNIPLPSMSSVFSFFVYLYQMDLWILILFYGVEPNNIIIYLVVYIAAFSSRYPTLGGLDLGDLRGIKETFHLVFTLY